jgi:hypothetical protein
MQLPSPRTVSIARDFPVGAWLTRISPLALNAGCAVALKYPNDEIVKIKTKNIEARMVLLRCIMVRFKTRESLHEKKGKNGKNEMC